MEKSYSINCSDLESPIWFMLRPLGTMTEFEVTKADARLLMVVTTGQLP